MANSDRGIDGAYNEFIGEEDADNSYHNRQQVYVSMLGPGAGLRRPRLLAVSLALLAAVMLLVNIGLGIYYNKLTAGHLTFDDVTHINHELIKIQDDYKIAMESMMYANRQLTKEVADHQLSKWELDHQKKRKTVSEAQTSKLHTDIATLQTQLTMTSEGCRRCLPGWVLMDSVCYYFSGNYPFKSWQHARDYCKTHGGDLVILDSASKQVSIVNHINFILPSSIHMNDRGYWIGMRDVHEEGIWKWLNGKMIVDGYWNTGEPNDINDEDCGAVYGRSNPFKTWNDVGCTERLRYICEVAPRATR